MQLGNYMVTNKNTIQYLQDILDALMSVSTKGNDTIIMSNCLQALQQVIQSEIAAQAKPVGEAQGALPQQEQ